MTKKTHKLILTLVICIVILITYTALGKPRIPIVDNFLSSDSTANSYKDLIIVDMPSPNEIISSPLVIKGQARGGWFFEANFPIVLLNQDGVKIGEAVAQAGGDWMTSEFVPFQAQLTFDKPTGGNGKGTLVFKKDNPSGITELDDSFSMPILFAK